MRSLGLFVFGGAGGVRSKAAEPPLGMYTGNSAFKLWDATRLTLVQWGLVAGHKQTAAPLNFVPVHAAFFSWTTLSCSRLFPFTFFKGRFS